MIIEVVDESLRRAGVSKQELTGIAATYGPGLVGALLVGLSFAKATAFALHVPFIGVNHIEGHLYSVFLEEPKPSYPFVCLIISGGHSILVYVEREFKHTLLGQTRDDAAGEAFDKVAKMLGLAYPGGPAIDKLAAVGNPQAIAFPRSFLEQGAYDFSFSGVKTAVLYFLRRHGYLDKPSALQPQQLADICASFQEAVVDVLVEKAMNAAVTLGVRDVAIAGGVSANSRLRKRMQAECDRVEKNLFFPKLEYCMDNGAMIAYVGWLKLRSGVSSPFDIPAVANLQLV